MPIIKQNRVTPEAPQQHKQPSRKGKKAWRKNVDITKIQEGLEEVRDEVIKGYVADQGLSEQV
jgi:nucleolar protein 53